MPADQRTNTPAPITQAQSPPADIQTGAVADSAPGERRYILSQRRLRQLNEAGLGHVPFVDGYRRRMQHWGSSAPLDALLDEDVPAAHALAGMQRWDDTDCSPWVVADVELEPDWHIEPHPYYSGWIVWEDRGHPWDRGSALIWRSEELARRYLELLTDNFWEGAR